MTLSSTHARAQRESHQEFVELLDEVVRRTDAGEMQLARRLLALLLEHAQQHFAEEEAWMSEIGYPSDPTREHASQHAYVLRLLRGVLASLEGEATRNAELDALLPELARWFRDHSTTLDARLAQHLGSRPTT